jgi:acetyl-CoA carboxylase biotin carboxyl carrier protein
VTKKRLEELLAFAETTDLEEVDWEKGDLRVNFRRSHGPEKIRKASVLPEGLASPGQEVSPPEPRTIRSTMVGTFYRADSPQRPPLVVEGTIVTGGQAVGSIEAMKIMKDVVSPSPCKIVKALVANGHPVEYGQPLFEIEPMRENV